MTPGLGIGDITLGARWSDIADSLPDATPLAFNRLGLVMARGLEVVLISSEDAAISEDAYVIGVAAKAPGEFTGPVALGTDRAGLVEAVGEPGFEAGGVLFYTEGMSIELDADGLVAKIAIIEPFEIDQPAPRMENAR